MINHHRKANIIVEYMSSKYVFVFASKDIAKGEEFLFDYCEELKDQK